MQIHHFLIFITTIGIPYSLLVADLLKLDLRPLLLVGRREGKLVNTKYSCGCWCAAP